MRLEAKAVSRKSGHRPIDGHGHRDPPVAPQHRYARSPCGSFGRRRRLVSLGLGDQETDGPAASTDGMGARLAAVRVEQGISKAAPARIVDLSPGTVGDIERGAQTGVDVPESVAAPLTVSPAWLAYNQSPQQLVKKRREASHNDSLLGTFHDRR